MSLRLIRKGERMMEQKEKLLKLIHEFGLCGYQINDLADYLLANGVVVSVRCRECKHRGTDDCPMHIKGVPANEDFLKLVDNDFCSCGERRSSEP